MPGEEYRWLPRQRLLRLPALVDLVSAFAALGVARLRLTGGEPLLRRDLPELVQALAAVPGIRELAMTTNGTRLAHSAAALRRAGLQRVTVSLDTLRRDRYRQLTGTDGLDRVLAGLDAACGAGYTAVKSNTVVIRGVNDDEVADLLLYAQSRGVEPRFIEYMDVGGATGWSPPLVVPRAELLAMLRARFGSVRAEPGRGAAPAERFVLPDGTRFGVVASVTEPFCGECQRGRLTADGIWYTCLYAREGVDLQRILARGGREGVMEAVRRVWAARTDRGAEERRRVAGRGVLYRIDELRQDGHLEMHKRGG